MMNDVHDVTHFLPGPWAPGPWWHMLNSLPPPSFFILHTSTGRIYVWRTAAFIRVRYSTVLKFEIRHSCPPCYHRVLLFWNLTFLVVHHHHIFEPIDYRWLSNDRMTGNSTPMIGYSSIFKHSHKLWYFLRRLGWVGFRLTLHEVRKHDRLLCPFSRVPQQFSRHILYHKVGIWPFQECDISAR